MSDLDQPSFEPTLPSQPTKPTKVVTYRPDYFRRQGKIWFVVSLGLLGLWFVLWIVSQSASNGKKHTTEAAPTVLDVATLPTKIDSMSETKNLVRPINFETVVKDLRSYPPEFKDRSYFENYKNKWAVQVMDVAENEVIVNYLSNRDDREKFAYFRYSDEHNQVRYLLTYGVMNSMAEAMGAARSVDFGLPSSVRVLPEEMKRFLAMIDNYERGVAEDEATSAPREVTLQETDKEIPAEAAPSINEKPKPKEEKAIEEKQEDKPDTSDLAKAPTARPIDMPENPDAKAKTDNAPKELPKPERQSQNSVPMPVNNSAPPALPPVGSGQIQSTQSDESY